MLLLWITRMIDITDRIAIPDSEVTFTSARSSGPGGQHVNKVSSRVTLHFNILTSQSLSAAQKQRLLSRLRTRISKDGVLRVVTQKHRSQAANRQAAVARFAALVQEALTPRRPRLPTATPAAAQEQRLQEKRQRSQRKQQRTTKIVWDE
jgi:ribosome-associated protein